jgi:O-succinylbenzoic acid--CoA ligase
VQVRVVHGAAVVTAVAACLEGGPTVVPLPDGDPPVAWRLADDLDEPGPPAAIVGTSGSTGEPKGVLLSRAAMTFAAQASHARLGGPGNWVCPLPVHYVAGLMTIARAHVAGGTVSLVPGDLSALPLHAGRNFVSIVAAKLHRALEEPATIAALAGFDAVLVGGSGIPAPLLARGREAGIPLVATYGMAETCGGCVYDGRPLDGVGLALEDERIVLSGPMAFSGYRLDPEATARTLDGDRVRTQDRGRLVDGALQVLGRLDEVVISGGVNVDLGLAQRACDAAFGLGALALLALPDERWGQRIVALTTLRLGRDEVAAGLRERVQPAAMPREVRRVAGLPLTATGKIDRRALPRVWAEGE